MRRHLLAFTLALATALLSPRATAGFDHRIAFDESGVWNRNVQQTLRFGTLAVVIGGAAWEGGESRLGRTFWQSLDSIVLADATAEISKIVFARSRPTQTDNPDQWFQGKNARSFPSGEVTQIAAAVTPFVLEYAHDHPGVWLLEGLVGYDMVARVKSQAHWQTDVLAGALLGTAFGFYAHHRESPLILSVLPQGAMVGLRKRF
jgi:membrane-associated phospholipid phosphatase